MHLLPLRVPMNLPARTLRNLALLTAAVIWVHGLMLGGLPQSLGWLQAVQAPKADAAAVFVTRTIAAPEPVAPQQKATVPVPLPASLRKPPSGNAAETATEAPFLKQKQPAAPVETAQDAPEFVAPQPAQTPPERPSGNTAALAAAAISLPAPVRLKYDVKTEIKGIPLSANADLLWLQDGKTYDARLEISHFLLGSRIQTSKGLVTPQGLEPIRFGDKVRSEVAAHFERDKGKVTFSANTPDVALLPGAQDQLSVLLQIASMVAADPAKFTRGTEMTFQAIGPRSAETWVFTAAGMETLQLPNGDTAGLKFTRPAVNEFEPRAEIWFGPEVGYLPIRVRITQSNGDFVDQLWRGTQKP